MFNTRQWVFRAKAFVERCRFLPGEVKVSREVLPPLSDAEANEIAGQLPRGLPDSLRRFYVEGSRSCFSTYHWYPQSEYFSLVFPDEGAIYGGPRFLSATSLPEYKQECDEWADGFDEYHGPESAEDSRLWHNSLPFFPIGNGDHLALDTTVSIAEPPVLYLVHDGGGQSRIISRSLDEFLVTWEELCYIGPEIWLLDRFLNSTTGMLGIEAPGVRELRKLFHPVFE